jgi:hypothetical protein
MLFAELGELESPVKQQPGSWMNEMARTSISKQDWEVFVRVADELGVDARGLLERDVRFCEMEAVGHKVGRKIAQAITERLSLARAERLTGKVPCPTCGKQCPVDHQERDLTTGDGPIRLCEPVCHCSTCRRDFFPSASRSGTRTD